jgi:hypothetical protein
LQILEYVLLLIMPRPTAVFLIEGDILSDSYEDQPQHSTNPRRREPTHKGHAQLVEEDLRRYGDGPSTKSTSRRTLAQGYGALIAARRN